MSSTELLEQLKKIIEIAKEMQKQNPNREWAIAITNLETGLLWAKHASSVHNL